MSTSQVRALARRAGALLGAVAVLAAGCATPRAGSGPRAGRAEAAVAASASSASSHGVAHRTARTTGPGVVRHSSRTRIAGPRTLFRCAPAVGHPVVSPVSAASGSRLVVPVCSCCRGCSCAWACCGCGPGRWPPRPHLVWLCCARWHPPPGWGSSPIPPACWPGCGALACPAGARVPVPGPAAAGSSQDRAPGGPTAGAS